MAMKEITGDHSVESYDQDILPLEEQIKAGGKDTGLFGMWVFFKRCRSV
jgi:hypothetical protein